MLLAIFNSINAFCDPELISVQVTGKGQPLILIHGMSCSPEVWDELVSKYQIDYEIHLVSFKGFGNMESINSDHILGQAKDELIAYVKTNKLKQPIIIGHSMGGFLGLWASADEPDLFGKIVSVDGVPYFPVLQMPGLTPETAKPMIEGMKNSLVNMDKETALNNQKMIVSTMIATEEKRAKVVEMGISSNPKVVGQAYGEMFTTDIRPYMSKIKVPVLVFGAWAAYKSFGATKESVINGYKNQLKDIEHLELLVADEAYHFVFYDEPEWFYSELDKFLKK